MKWTDRSQALRAVGLRRVGHARQWWSGQVDAVAVASASNPANAISRDGGRVDARVAAAASLGRVVSGWSVKVVEHGSLGIVVS